MSSNFDLFIPYFLSYILLFIQLFLKIHVSSLSLIFRLAPIQLIYESAQKLFILYKNPIFWNVLLSDLIEQLGNEFLTGKGDDICRKIVKEEYFTFVRLEK